MTLYVTGGNIVNEGKVQQGTLVIEDGRIVDIVSLTSHLSPLTSDEVIDASGCYVLPGVIDDHVHFREPGLTEKADIDTESQAAAAGGVTTFFDMPNTQSDHYAGGFGGEICAGCTEESCELLVLLRCHERQYRFLCQA